MVEHNPYRPPQASVAGASAGPEKPPGVWHAYVVYCVAMALLYALLFAGGLLFLILAPGAGLGGEEMSPVEAGIMAVLFGGLGLVLAVPFAAAPFLPKRPWTWVVGIVLISLGLTSCLTLPFCIALLLFWLKPENQAFFGKVVHPPANQQASG